MPKPVLIMDQYFRQVEELFSPDAFRELEALCDIFGGTNWPMDRAAFLERLPHADFVVAAKPDLQQTEIDASPQLRAIIEVSGTFQPGIDYDLCFQRGIEVLSCAPGFRYSVAEMTLGLMLAGARGIVEEHCRFQDGSERWLDDNIGSDFSLYGQSIGFVGFGSIAKECVRLLSPFSPKVTAFDPWMQASGAEVDEVKFTELETVVKTSRCLVIAAAPTDENYQILSRDLISKIPRGALVVVISRAHLVDFSALTEAAEAGRLRLACDVFPQEPVSKKDKIRSYGNTIWSPHRAAAVEGGRHPIGDMVVHDIREILSGGAERQLQAASPDTIRNIIRAPLAAG